MDLTHVAQSDKKNDEAHHKISISSHGRKKGHWREDEEREARFPGAVHMLILRA